jgi:hypothetical protein
LSTDLQGALIQTFGPGLPDFFDKMYQNGGKYTKLPLNYQMAIKYTKWPKKFLMAIKFANIFHRKTLQNLTKFCFFLLQNIQSDNPDLGQATLCWIHRSR